MSFLGKILIVAQVVLSVLFMCAAGAVYSTHVNWQKAHVDQKAQLDKAVADRKAEADSLNQKLDEITKEKDAEKNRADENVGRVQALTQENAGLTQRNNTLNSELQRQSGLAEAKSNEAVFRQQEAERERAQNDVLGRSLDDERQKNASLQDELGTTKQSLEELTTQHEATLAELSTAQKQLRLGNVALDAQTVAAMPEPPPPVDGVVREVRKDQTNRTKFVYISLGSDDGLRVGNELDVYRPAERNNGRAKYLGRIRIWSVMPDTAVGLVIEAAKNGIIEVGDNVTTKL
jgi:hypothetical protein